MIPNVVYNMGTGVLRAVGDARRPLYFLIAASLCNIVLDLVLVVGFGLAVLGVALATVLSQLLSAVLVVLSLMRSQGQAYQLFPRQLRLYGRSAEGCHAGGRAAALQSVMYSASNLVIQAAINSFGTDAVAAWTAYGKMDVIFWMSINAMALAITTFAGQNYGAGPIRPAEEGRAGVGRHERGLYRAPQHRHDRVCPADPEHILPRPGRAGDRRGHGALSGALLYHVYPGGAAPRRDPGSGQIHGAHAHLGVRRVRAAAGVAVYRGAGPSHHRGRGAELSHHLGGHFRSRADLLPLGALAAAAERDGINDRTQRCGSGQGLPRRR